MGNQGLAAKCAAFLIPHFVQFSIPNSQFFPSY